MAKPDAIGEEQPSPRRRHWKEEIRWLEETGEKGRRSDPLTDPPRRGRGVIVWWRFLYHLQAGDVIKPRFFSPAPSTIASSTLSLVATLTMFQTRIVEHWRLRHSYYVLCQFQFSQRSIRSSYFQFPRATLVISCEHAGVYLGSLLQLLHLPKAPLITGHLANVQFLSAPESHYDVPPSIPSLYWEAPVLPGPSL